MPKRSRAPVILSAAAGLVFLLLGLAAWRLLDQERALVRERDRERLENAASLAIRETERAIAQASREPDAGPQSAPIPILELIDVNNLAIHPDGKSILWRKTQTETSTWVMENFLPAN